MTNTSSTPDQRRGVRIAARALITTATAAAFVGMAGLSASAAPGDTALDSVVANVNVNSTISLSLDQANFTINGTPLSEQTKTGAVTGTVVTNNVTGYSIGVVAAAATLQPTLNGNTDTIPIGNLEVTNAAGDLTAISNLTSAPVITTTKATRSFVGDVDTDPGDLFSDDYKITIPDVNSDTYHVTLNYTATALA
jgi:hypothetical protein